MIMKKYNDILSIAALAALCVATAGCGDDSALAEKGEKAFDNGDFDKAASLFLRASRMEPSSPALKYNNGVALAKQGDSNAAAAAFEEVLAVDPEDLDAAEYLAVELEKTENFDEAHRLMIKVLGGRTAGTAAYARALNTTAKIEFGLNRPDLAIIRLLKAKDTAPDYAPTYFNLAKLYGESFGLYSTAAGYIEKYLQAAGSGPSERDAAEKLLQAYLQMPSRPLTKAIPPSAAEDSFQKGVASYKRGKYIDAEQHFAKAEKSNPNSYYASLFRAHTLLASKKYKDAENSYKTASIKATAEIEPVYWMGIIACTELKYGKALDIFTKQAIPGWPDDIRAYQTAAEIYDKLGQTESQKNGNSDVFFFASAVYAERCRDIAAVQGKSIPSIDLILKKCAARDFSALTLSDAMNQIP